MLLQISPDESKQMSRLCGKPLDTKCTFRLWEVVSIIQDLPPQRQLEILDKLNLASVALTSSVFRSYFVLSDSELLATELIQKFLGEIARSRHNFTRLSVVYTLTLLSSHREKPLKKEFNEYFATLPFENEFVLLRILLPLMSTDNMKESLVAAAVSSGLESVRKITETWDMSDTLIFEQAIVQSKPEIVDELLIDLDEQKITDYVQLTLKYVDPITLEKILNAYEGDRSYLLNFYPYWEPNDTDERTQIRVRMLLSIDPEAVEHNFVNILSLDPKLFSFFILETLSGGRCHNNQCYSWLKYIDTPVVYNILNNQV